MRRGLGKGLGTGYRNLAPMDSHIHSLSARGVKTLTTLKKEFQLDDKNEPYSDRIYVKESKKFYDVLKTHKRDSLTSKDRAHYDIAHELIDKGKLDAKGKKSLYAKMSADELEKNLSMFTGTEQYHRLSYLPLLATDGVAYLMENAEAFWLFDAIASYQPKLKKEEFQVWFLEKNKTGSGAVLKGYRDYSEKNPDKFKPLVTQKIPYTDFPLKKVKLYVQNGVALLPSEY